MVRRLLHHRKSNRSGLAIVEFAIALPVFVLIVMATIESSSMIFMKQSLEISAYEGVRTALVRGSNENNVIGSCNQILEARSVTAAVVTVTPSNFSSLNYGDYIQVSVAAPCSENSLLGPWFYGGRTLVATAEMMKEF
ncbi:MAG: Flp pilus assembly protein TadG [Pirellulaceae bacterium]|jgi:Flp pilus assembly protein TadG